MDPIMSVTNANVDIQDLIMELDAVRVSRGISYQALADACGVSKSTIYRTLTLATEPTMQLVQDIAAAVQYRPPEPENVPDGYNKDSYITYLQEELRIERAEKERRIRQIQSHYNMLRKQDQRIIHILGVISLLLVAFVCIMFVYDFTHSDRGWIQAHIAGIVRSGADNALYYIQHLLGRVL